MAQSRAEMDRDIRQLDLLVEGIENRGERKGNINNSWGIQKFYCKRRVKFFYTKLRSGDVYI